ncbi:hypothetical protein MYX82_04175 [Acidobacteria bacterium AH-259-D05]|nr:hypothetical protein [Acidobacteria bacterium AH-259-D05]
MVKLLRGIQALLLKLAKAIGRINTFVMLSLSFYGLLFPLALLRRLFVRTLDEGGNWHTRKSLPKDHFRKQY